MSHDAQIAPTGGEIAVIGMSGRFPGARTLAQYWDNLREGRESIRPLTDDELRAAGVPQSDIADPRYVKVCGELDAMDEFDAGFFGYSPKDAAILDPQHRCFHEACWEALESAGQPPRTFPGSIGLFAGCGMNSYFMHNILSNPDLVRSVGMFLLRHTGNDRDFLPTTISYKLNLRGPSIAVQTACSTSLVAVHMACQSLLSGECDIALAGGVTVILPHRHGYHYAPNEVQSPDGHCRPFDAKGAGTVLTSGVGAVALRRLQDALDDGDPILAVIRGSAINNDGAGKVGYLAPSVDGHARAVVEALAVAGLGADDISYVEAHGTGTLVGDPIEIAALTQAFRASTSRTGFCRIGSVKANIGHLDTAAGVASLIKVVEALNHRELPPSINFEEPNPAADWGSSPFVVNTRLTPWTSARGPLRAGVSSLGVGGTNAHVVVEEAPKLPPTDPARPWEILTFSAKTPGSLDRACAAFVERLRADPSINLGDAAHTLQVGREAFERRRAVSVRDSADAIGALTSKDASRVVTGRANRADPSVVFMFPGGGSQRPGMGRELHETEPVFRAELDRCLTILLPLLEADLRTLLLVASPSDPDAVAALARPCASVCAVFAVEYALAKLWMSWGVTPAAMTGHSLGEYTAACLAGVMSLDDALRIVALRGALVERAPEAAMVSVQMPESALRERLNGELDLAVVNSPSLCVVAGLADRLRRLETELAEMEVDCKRLRLTGASHSRFVEPILDEFRAALSRVRLSAPTIPYVSNVTGAWVRPEDATSPDYWLRHFRNTVRFSDGLAEILRQDGRVMLEVGPGQTLSSLVRQQPAKPAAVVSSMPHNDDDAPAGRVLANAVGALWAAGVPIDFARVRGPQRRRRIPLPTYSWDRERYFIEPGTPAIHEAQGERDALTKAATIDEWFSRPVWRERPLASATPAPVADAGPVLIFLDRAGLGAEAARLLRAAGRQAVTVREGDAFYRLSDNEYALSPETGRDGYESLFADLAKSGRLPSAVLHCWMVTPDESFRPGSSFFHRNQERGFYSLLFIAQALGALDARPALRVVVASTDMQRIGDTPCRYPDKATLLGPVRVMGRELPGVGAVSVDFAMADLRPSRRAASGLADAARALVAEIGSGETEPVALRAGVRFCQTLEKAPLAPAPAPLRAGGVCLITGGMSGVGLEIARRLARAGKPKLVLLGRSALPPRDRWDAHLAAHPSRDRVSERIRAVRSLEALGAEVLPLACDVASVDALSGALAETRRRFGALHAVFHAAGDIEDGVMQTKSPEICERVIAPKVHGTLLLAGLLRDTPLDFFAVCSSSSSITGPAGQADYAGANAFLDAFAESDALPRARRVLAINWGVWKGVGMATPISQRLRGEADDAGSIVLGLPLLHERVASSERERVYSTTLTATDHWVLDEHRTRAGQALLPGTGYLAMAHAAAADAMPGAGCEIRDISFLSPLAVGDDESREARLTLRRESVGWSFAVSSRRAGRAEAHGWLLHAEGSLRPAGDASAPAPLDIGAVRARCPRAEVAPPGAPHLRTGQFEHVAFGPRWSSIRAMWYGDQESLALLELPDAFRDDLAEHALHPATLDLATGYAMDLIPGYRGSGAMYVPLSYHRVRVHGPLPARVYSRVVGDPKNAASAEVAAFDVTICDEHGNVLVEVERFVVRRLESAGAFAAPVGTDAAGARPSADASSDAGDAPPLSPGERLFLETYEAGIEAEEGAEAFVRALAAPAEFRRIVASPVDLGVVSRRMASLAAAPTGPGVRFSRPTLDSEFEAPRDNLERALAGWWEDLLGVERVGIHDSFFDLGGHSLIAVRLFAKIRKAYDVEYPISVLFEAPTIAGCAEMLRRELGDAADTGSGAAARQSGDAAPQRKRRFLVPMRVVKDSPKAPFFLVAGMFGNVLNLRHLAAHLGEDQTVYAIQARGLYGDDPPHTSFEEMARDYLAEIREVQPHGPYFLGGFSGGGNTAFEMAQQLARAGEEAAFLALLDSRPAEMPSLSRADKALIHAQRIRARGPAYITDWARKRLEWERRKRTAQPGAAAQDLTPAEFRSKEIERAFYTALGAYRTRVYAGDVHLFRPALAVAHRLPGGRMTTKDRLFLDHHNHWKPFVAGEVIVHEVTGDHDSMVLEPHVRCLSGRLRAALEAAHAAAAARAAAPRAPHPQGAPSFAGAASA